MAHRHVDCLIDVCLCPLGTCDHSHNNPVDVETHREREHGENAEGKVESFFNSIIFSESTNKMRVRKK